MNSELNKPSIIIGLAFCAGIGLTLMILALGVGVVQGEAASNSLLNISFLAGLAMLIIGSVAWFAIVQPQKNFDDINLPQDNGHHATVHHDAEEQTLATIHPDNPVLVENKH